MAKSNKNNCKNSSQKTSAKKHGKNHVSYAGEKAEKFLSLVTEIQSQVISEFIHSVLERIAIKKGFDSDDMYYEIANLALKDVDDLKTEKNIEMIAQKIINGKNVVEL